MGSGRQQPGVFFLPQRRPGDLDFLGSGFNLRRVTAYRGPDVSPVWNPKTGTQIAWISGRTGLPQVYIMDSDGTGVQRMTDGGYATSPSWSPNGQFLAFAWSRHYGPGAPGGQDIYVMDIASHRWIQLTHDIGRTDFPSWSPDGRHIVFQVGASRAQRDMDDAGRRNRAACADQIRQWANAELELEVIRSFRENRVGKRFVVLHY